MSCPEHSRIGTAFKNDSRVYLSGLQTDTKKNAFGLALSRQEC